MQFNPKSGPMPKLNITFLPPRHGWLPVRLGLGDRVIEFPAFHGPNNPVKETYRAILAALRGETGTVWWHTEPDGYFFELSRVHRTFHLRVLHADHSLFSQKKEVAVVSGSAQDIIQPLLVALRDFVALDIEPSHWRNTEFPGLQALEQAALEVA